MGRSGGRLRDAYDNFEIGRQRLALVSGPSSTEITTSIRKSIVLTIIGMAKPKFICIAR